KYMKLTVYGSWHLAEVYAVGLCELGHEVRLVSESKVCQNYKQGKPPVFEPGIAEGIKKYTESGNLSFSSNITDTEQRTDICFFAQDVNVVPAGVDMKDIESHFEKVAKSGLFKIIIVSSQTPIGTMRVWQKKYKTLKIIYFPEFLRFGDALKRFIEPDSIVLGGDEEAVKSILGLFDKINSPKFCVTLEEAEMSKHAANIFVATTVSFISELTKLSEHFNINFEHIGQILRADKRVGTKAYTLPGLGFAGTVERDFRVLFNVGKKLKIKFPMLRQIIAVNNEHNAFMEKEIRKHFKKMEGKKVGFLGATYKPFTSNMRGSLVEPLMKHLEKEGARVVLYDPLVEDNVYKVDSLEEVFSGADAVVIAVGKKEFKEASYHKLIASMKKKIIIDAANMFTKEDAKKLHVDYSSIGRGKF
ncbi:MAG: nucleotide sugar dehydrogenase, partial [bacterium]|nr:nucleotide sugar dehydrogenase [bacterium]